MQYRSLGKSGLKVSAIGLGTNQFGGKVDQSTSNNIIAAALDGGVNLIDTADVYQNGRSEEFIGKALQGKREKALIATKGYFSTGEGPNDRGASRHHILSAVEASLRRLNTEAIDLYQIHRWDDETPIQETMQVLDDLIRSGKVRYIGASNFSAWQLVWANDIADKNNWTKMVSIQPHYHMFERTIESELIPACLNFKIGILPYFPLAGGFLTGKYKVGEPPPPDSRGATSQYVQNYLTPKNHAILDNLITFTQNHNHNMVELAHAWLLAQSQISSVISGATRVEQVQANIASAEWILTNEEVQQVNQILGNHNSA